MLRSKLNKILLSSALCVGMLANTSLVANAADFGSQIDIEVKATTVDVTVPSSAPFVFNEDETNTLPSNWTIKNNSKIARVYVSKISVDGTDASWKVVDGTYDLKTMPVNTKNVRLKFGKEGALKLVAPKSGTENAQGEYVFGASDIVVPAGQTQELKFDIERGSFTQTQASSKAFNMTVEFNFS